MLIIGFPTAVLVSLHSKENENLKKPSSCDRSPIGPGSHVPEDRVRSDLVDNRSFAWGYGCIPALPLFR